MNYKQYQAHLELGEEYTEVCRIVLRWILDDRIEEAELLLTLFRDYAVEVENLINQRNYEL
jgi:hypothetical protein